MVDDGGPVGLDAVQVAFNDERVVSDAGIMLAATLAERLEIEELIDDCVRLGVRGAASRAGRKVMALIYAMALGTDSIDDFRYSGPGGPAGCWALDPGPVDARHVLARVYVRSCPPAGPCPRRLAQARMDGRGRPGRRAPDRRCRFVCRRGARLRQAGAAFGYTRKRGYHPILASRAETGEVLHLRLRKGSANTQRGILRFTDELIARVNRAGATGPKLMRADSGFWNIKVFMRLERAGWTYSIGIRMAKHVRAAVELIDETAWTTIADVPDSGEAQLAETHARRPSPDRAAHPSRRRPSRAVPGLASPTAPGRSSPPHNLLRWTELLGAPGQIIRAARTVRRRWLAMPGRLTTHAARWTLHLPARWPWQHDFNNALTRLRALPAAA